MNEIITIFYDSPTFFLLILCISVTPAAGQGDSHENPILIPSKLEERTVGICDESDSHILWFNVKKDFVHYVPEVRKHFKLTNPE